MITIFNGEHTISKYDPFARYLCNYPGNVWNASFAEVENVLGAPLPRSAYQFPAWWANQADKGHSQTHGWIGAGWKTSKLNLQAQTVHFERHSKTGGDAATANDLGKPPWSPSDMLFARAESLTGISDRDEMVGLALEQLIASLTASRLAGRGGTMPGLRVPPRERPET